MSSNLFLIYIYIYRGPLNKTNPIQKRQPYLGHLESPTMSFSLLHLQTSSPLSISISCCSFTPNKPPSSSRIPARDRIIDFGKYKGKMLGTLPSKYLKWVSKTLRARDFEEWAKLADQVLEDPVYKDRMEWEVTQNILSGNNVRSSSRNNVSAVDELVEVSKRFGWDNEDKEGWREVDFEMLGTSKGGRIPRVREGERREKVEERESGGDEGNDKRRVRRGRVRMKKRGETEGKMGNSGVRNDGSMVSTPFTGREALLRKVLNRGRNL